MQIYFDEALFEKALETIKDARDYADVLRDLERIKQAEANVNSYMGVFLADQLSRELRDKYETIGLMLNIADNMRSNPLLPLSPQDGQICSAEEAAISNLEQDRCGILCDTIVKKGLTQNIRNCIKSVS